jgi:hypothetical protein
VKDAIQQLLLSDELDEEFQAKVKRSLASIYDCGYIGPLVLCSMGMSKRMIAEAWNNHINPLPSVTTCDLVLELLKRDENILWVELGNDDDTHRDNIDFSLHDPINGPAKILVVTN